MDNNSSNNQNSFTKALKPTTEKLDKPLLTPTYFALALAIAPALGYFYAFNYEKGYLSFFGVPEHYISLDVTTIIRGTMFLLPTFVFIFLFITVANAILVIYFPNFFKSPYKAGVFFTLPFVFIFGIYVYGRGINHIAYLTLGMIAMQIFKYYVYPLFFKELGPTYKERLAVWDKILPDSQTLLKYSNKHFGIFGIFKYFFIMLLIIYIPQIIGDNFGYREARTEKSFLVNSSTSEEGEEMVALRIYNYNAIFAPYDRSTRKVYSEFIIIDIQNSELMLSLENIGPLLPAKRPNK